MKLNKPQVGKLLVGGAALLVVVLFGVALFAFQKGGSAPAVYSEPYAEVNYDEEPELLAVRVTTPQPGGIERKTTQPGTVRAFELEEIYAKVSGYLKNQKVDIGTFVKTGDVLAEIEAPELVMEEQHAAASLRQTKAQVKQMQAHLDAAEADLDAARVLISQRKAEVHRATSNLGFRGKQYERIKELVDNKALDQKMLDEQFEQRESAEAWKDASEAGVKTAQADVEAKKAKVAQATADLEAARANVDVADAALQKARVFVEFTRIRSHYDGVVTRRFYHNGHFIRAAEHGAVTPLFVVQRTDRMRVIVQVPDQDACLCDPGDPVDLTVSTLPGVKFADLKVSRVANSQDQANRTMRVEVDVSNAEKYLRDGMYGDVTIHLQQGAKNAFRVPSSALRRERNKALVFVEKDNVVHQVEVKVGADNGSEVEILSGLHSDDHIVLQPSHQLHDGMPVRADETGHEHKTGSHHG